MAWHGGPESLPLSWLERNPISQQVMSLEQTLSFSSGGVSVIVLEP